MVATVLGTERFAKCSAVGLKVLELNKPVGYYSYRLRASDEGMGAIHSCCTIYSSYCCDHN